MLLNFFIFFATQDFFTADWPSLIKHSCLAYLPTGAIIFTPLCLHHHRCYLLTASPSLPHLFSCTHRQRCWWGPSQPWETLISKAQTQTLQSLWKWFDFLCWIQSINKWVELHASISCLKQSGLNLKNAGKILTRAG